jgi:hypothetical protein
MSLLILFSSVSLSASQEQFLLWLATRAHLQAAGQKRKGLRAQDVEHLVRSTAKLEFLRAPLKRDFETFAANEANASEQRKERMEEMHKRKKKQKNDEGETTTGEEGQQQEQQEDEVNGAAENAASKPAPTPKPKPKPTRTIDSMFGKV